MATLGDLKSYAADMAADAADGKAARVILRHVNAALRRVSNAHDWSFYAARYVIPLDVGVAGSALSAAASATEVTLGGAEVFLQRYVDEAWDLKITGEDNVLFQLASLVTPQRAQLATGQRWFASAASAVAWTMRRGRYSLPDGCREVREVMLSDSRVQLVYLRPDLFDGYKLDQPTLGGDPQHYTVRGNYLELWPALESTSTAQALLLSYRRQPVDFTSAMPDTTPVDFEARWNDLLERAIDVEVAAHHRGSHSLDPTATMRLYEERLGHYKSLDGVRVQQRRQFRLGKGRSLKTLEEWVMRRGTTGSDVP